MKHIQNCSTPISNRFIENNPFSLRTIQSVHKDLQLGDVNHFNNYFTIIWITAGNASLLSPDPDNNYFLFIKPGQFNTARLNNATEGYVFCFNQSFLGIEDHDSESLFRSLSQMFTVQSLVLTSSALAEMQDITKHIIKEYNNINLYRTEILRRYFKIFLIYLSRHFDEPQPVVQQSRNMELFQSFVSLLEQNFRNQKMVADYADVLAVTPNYLNEVIKKITGYPAGYHIRQRVALEAKRKASASNIGMKEVAYDLGFFDLAHFSKFFKNATGVSFPTLKKPAQVL